MAWANQNGSWNNYDMDSWDADPQHEGKRLVVRDSGIQDNAWYRAVIGNSSEEHAKLALLALGQSAFRMDDADPDHPENTKWAVICWGKESVQGMRGGSEHPEWVADQQPILEVTGVTHLLRDLRIPAEDEERALWVEGMSEFRRRIGNEADVMTVDGNIVVLRKTGESGDIGCGAIRANTAETEHPFLGINNNQYDPDVKIGGSAVVQGELVGNQVRIDGKNIGIGPGQDPIAEFAVAMKSPVKVLGGQGLDAAVVVEGTVNAASLHAGAAHVTGNVICDAAITAAHSISTQANALVGGSVQCTGSVIAADFEATGTIATDGQHHRPRVPHCERVGRRQHRMHG